jgi:hypothetical protein
MIAPPICFERKCLHYKGIRSHEPDSDAGEYPVCSAFPHGIPKEIYKGDNLHLSVMKGQVGAFVYEEGVVDKIHGLFKKPDREA